MRRYKDLSFTVTKRDYPTLNHAGDTIENPLIHGVNLQLKLHKWHKDVRLRKAWVTVGGSIYSVITSGAVESTNYFSWTFQAGHITTGAGTLLDKRLLSGTPPVKNTVHITTTNGTHTPVRYRHSAETDADNDNLIFYRPTLDRPGGQQIKFDIWVTAKPDSQVLLDGYNAGSECEPLIYPLKGVLAAPTTDVPFRIAGFKSKRDFTEPPDAGV